MTITEQIRILPEYLNNVPFRVENEIVHTIGDLKALAESHERLLLIIKDLLARGQVRITGVRLKCIEEAEKL